MEIIIKHSSIFSKFKLDIGQTELLDHRIKTFNGKPIYFKLRRIPRGLEEDVNRIVVNTLVGLKVSAMSIP